MLIPKYVLEGLDELSIENLKSNRITSHSMNFAARKVKENRPSFDTIELATSGRFPSFVEMALADQINDMLEAARILHDKTLEGESE